MPKLDANSLSENKAAIEAAALKCFLKYGYHGVSVRQIADAAGVSIGNLYNYFPDKLSIFRSVFKKLASDFQSQENPIWKYLLHSDFPNDIEKMADVVEQSVKKYASYFKMTYIDVVEFDGEHASKIFSNVYDRFSSALSSRLKGKTKGDPVFGFVAVYMQFYYFFALKHLFKAKNIYGHKSDKAVVKQLISLYSF